MDEDVSDPDLSTMKQIRRICSDRNAEVVKLFRAVLEEEISELDDEDKQEFRSTWLDRTKRC